jgi:hypothetical protein
LVDDMASCWFGCRSDDVQQPIMSDMI